MGTIVAVIDEVRNRIQKAKTSGDLSSVKSVRVGKVFDARKLSNFPVINIRSTRGEGRFYSTYQQTSDLITLEIRLIDSKLEYRTTNNTLYNIENDNGIYILFEKLLNVIEKNTDGEVDLTFNSTAYGVKNYRYNVVEVEENYVEIVLDIEIQTHAFSIGGR